MARPLRAPWLGHVEGMAGEATGHGPKSNGGPCATGPGVVGVVAKPPGWVTRGASSVRPPLP
jgi:hypothetical protein